MFCNYTTQKLFTHDVSVHNKFFILKIRAPNRQSVPLHFWVGTNETCKIDCNEIYCTLLEPKLET